MNIEEKEVHPSFIHPSIHPSFMVQWWVLLIFGQKTLVFVNTPLLSSKKFENSSWRVKGWYGWKIHMWMVHSHPYHGCMVNLPCSMDMRGFCAWVHPYHGEFTMDGPMHTASQVLTTFTTTKLMYGWAQTYEAPCMMDA